MAHSENTSKLLGRIRDGESGALSQLLQQNLVPLRQWARGQVPANARDRFNTDDLVQESIIALVPRLGEIERKGPGAIQAYLRRTFVNRIRNEIKRAGRRPTPVELHTAVPGNERDQLKQLVDDESMQRYENCLTKLKEQEQAAIFMRLELGLSYDEIANELDKPSANTARMMVSRAVARLAELMRDEG